MKIIKCIQFLRAEKNELLFNSKKKHYYKILDKAQCDKSPQISNCRRLTRLLRNYKSLEDVFRQSTDGANCSASRFYKKDEFINILNQSGFSGVFKGASISNWMEMSRLNKRFEALIDRRLPKEHRNFLYNLSFNKDGAPIYNGTVAGIGGCDEAIPL